MNIVSVFDVVDFKTGATTTQGVTGAGQESIKTLRKAFPRFTKFVLKGFQIDGVFKKLNLATYNYIR